MLVKEYVERESRRITRTQAIARWLEKKWGHDRKCPYCNEREWTVDTEPVLFPRLGKGGDQGIPAYLVRCENCGNEVPLSAEVLGLWPDEM